MRPPSRETMKTQYIDVQDIAGIRNPDKNETKRKASHAIFLYDGLDEKKKKNIEEIIDHFSVDGLKISKLGLSSYATDSKTSEKERFLNALKEKIKSGEIASDTIIFMNFHTYADDDVLFFSIKGLESNFRIATHDVYEYIWSFFPDDKKPSFHNLGCNAGYYSRDLVEADGHVINYSGESPISSREVFYLAKEILRFVTVSKKIHGSIPSPEKIWQHMEHYVTQEMSIAGQGLHKTHSLMTPQAATVTTTTTTNSSTTTTTTTTTTTNDHSKNNAARQSHKNPKTLIEYAFRHRPMHQLQKIMEIHDPKNRLIGSLSENAKKRILFHIVPNRVSWLKFYGNASMPNFLVELLAHSDSEYKFLFCKNNNLFPNPVGEKRSTRFLIASCEDGNSRVAKLILESPEFSISNQGIKAALLAAINAKSQPLVELLIDKVSDFDIGDTDGNNVFHLASCQADAGIMALLLDSKIPVKLADDNTAEQTLSMADFLNQKNKQGVIPLEIAIQRNKVDMVKKLLEAGANPDALNSVGKHLIRQAVFRGNASIVGLLLFSQFKFSATDIDFSLLLRRAITRSHDEIAMTLISHCIATGQLSELNKPDVSGETPLMLAVQNQNKKLIMALLESGSDINAKNYEGYTVLHYALKNKDKELSKYLLKSGIDLKAKGFDIDSALDLARDSDDNLAIQFIRAAMKERN